MLLSPTRARRKEKGYCAGAHHDSLVWRRGDGVCSRARRNEKATPRTPRSKHVAIVVIALSGRFVLPSQVPGKNVIVLAFVVVFKTSDVFQSGRHCCVGRVGCVGARRGRRHDAVGESVIVGDSVIVCGETVGAIEPGAGVSSANAPAWSPRRAATTSNRLWAISITTSHRLCCKRHIRLDELG